LYILSALGDILRLFKSAKHKHKELVLKDPTIPDAGKEKEFSSEFVFANEKTELKQLQNFDHFIKCIKKLDFLSSFAKFRYNRNDWPLNWDA